MRGDDLTMSWGGRRAHVLAPLAKNRFEFDHGTQQVTFSMQTGTAKSLVWRTEDGDEWRMPRKVEARAKRGPTGYGADGVGAGSRDRASGSI